jgi:hypothetical protein
MWHRWEKREKSRIFWWESSKEKDHLEDRDIDGRMESECILWRLAGFMWIGFNWLRIGTGGELL